LTKPFLATKSCLAYTLSMDRKPSYAGGG